MKISPVSSNIYIVQRRHILVSKYRCGEEGSTHKNVSHFMHKSGYEKSGGTVRPTQCDTDRMTKTEEEGILPQQYRSKN